MQKVSTSEKDWYKELLCLGYGIVAITYVQTVDFELELKEECKVYHENAPIELKCEK